MQSLIDDPVSAEALARGFSLEAYQLNDPRYFEMIPLCDGGDKAASLFLFLWPAEEKAKSYDAQARSGAYLSNIHSHPIPCAFAVLKGEVTERVFEEVGEGQVICIE